MFRKCEVVFYRQTKIMTALCCGGTTPSIFRPTSRAEALDPDRNPDDFSNQFANPRVRYLSQRFNQVSVPQPSWLAPPLPAVPAFARFLVLTVCLGEQAPVSGRSKCKHLPRSAGRYSRRSLSLASWRRTAKGGRPSLLVQTPRWAGLGDLSSLPKPFRLRRPAFRKPL